MNFFKENLRYLTKTTKINQNQLAIKLDQNRQNITSWLIGREPKYDILIKISEIYQISIDSLLKEDLSIKE